MNLVKAQELAKDLSIQELQKYANGFNPAMMPPYIALGALQAKEAMQKKMAALQGGAQGEQPSVKEQIEQKAGLMALQQQQQNQAQQQMAQQAQKMPMPAPEGIPEPVAQPEPEQSMDAPMGMAQGGITRLPVQFNFDEGGIIGYAEGELVEDPQVSAAKEAAIRYSGRPMSTEQVERLKALIESRKRERAMGEASAARGDMYPPTMRQAEAEPVPEVQPMAEQLSPSDKALRSAPAGLAGAIQKPPVDKVASLLQAPKPAGLPLAAAPAEPAAMNMSPNQDQLIAEEAARRKAFGITGEAGAGAEGRMAARRAQYEAAKPSGLDDLIRVFGQAGQYKGLSGLGPAYTSNEDRKRAQQAAFEAQMEEQQTGIESARRAEGASRAGTIGTELGKSRELAQKEKEARERNLTLVEVANIQAATASRPGETERMMAEYSRLKASNPTAAEQYMQNIMRIKSGVSGDRQDLAELKNLQAYYKDRLDLVKGATVSKEDKADAAKKLNEINNKIASMAGIGGATNPTATRIKFDAAGNPIK